MNRQSALVGWLLTVASASAIVVNAEPWELKAKWLAFSLDLTRSPNVSVHWSVQNDCSVNPGCFIVDQVYDARGEFFNQGGGVQSVRGAQTSFQVLGHHLASSWETRNVSFFPIGQAVSLQLSSQNVGPWTGITLLSSQPSDMELTVDPPSALYDFHLGPSGVRMLFAHDFNATADAMAARQIPVTEGLGPQAGAAAGIAYSVDLQAQRGLLGMFDPWWTSSLYQAGREGTWQGPNGEYGNCIDRGPAGSCLAFVFHGGPGTRRLSSLERVCECVADEPWVFYLDERPPAVPPG